MEKKRLEIIITVGLIIVFIFALSSSIMKIRSRFRPAVSPVASLPAAPGQNLSGEVTRADLGEYKEHKLSWGRCPFAGKVYTAQEGTEVINLRLNGIVWDTKNPQALINGRVVQEGDSVGQFVVMKIYSDRVALLQGDKILQLKLEK